MLRSPLWKFITVSIFLLAIIWGAGPYIAISGKNIFESPISKILPSLVIVITWCAFALLYLLHRFLSAEVPNKKTTNLQFGMQKTIQDRFEELRDFLKKQKLPNLFTRKYPWVLVIGAAGSGKTQLLAHANLKLVRQQKSDDLDKLKSTPLLDWWVNSQALFIDTSGQLTAPKETHKNHSMQWQQLLNLIKHYRGNPMLDGLILLIDFPTLSNTGNENYNNLIAHISDRLTALRNYSERLPVYIIVTKCDRIRGFNEYFADLTQTEREQMLGIELSGETTDLTVAQAQLTEFISKLSHQLIWRLHHEQSINRRSYIQNFPLQMEKLAETLDDFIHQLPWHQTIKLKGIYFTSTKQKNSHIDLLAESMHRSFKISSQINEQPQHASQPFFIKQLFSKISSTQIAAHTIPLQQQRLRFLAIPIAILVVLLFSWLWHQGYYQNLHSIAAMQKQLGSNKTQIIPAENLAWLTRLDQLAAAVNSSNQKILASSRWLGLPQVKNLHDSALKLYQLQLKSIFQPYLKNLLHTAIRQNLSGSMLTLYTTLKVYIAITKCQTTQRQQINTWFAKLWSQQYPDNPRLTKSLINHLNALLNMRARWNADNPLVETARTKINSLPIADIAFLILADNYQKSPILLLKNTDNTSSLDARSLVIPAFYSSKYFLKIYNHDIPNLPLNLTRNNVVLGKTAVRMLNAYQSANLIKTVRALYIDFYTAHWLHLIKQIKLKEPKNYTQWQYSVKLITDKNSDLYKLLKIISNSVNLDKHRETNNKSSIIITNFLNDKTKNISKALQAINRLQLYITKIAAASNQKKSSYYASATRFENGGLKDPITTTLAAAKQLPEPIQSWIQTLSDSAWHIMLNNSKLYLNDVWQTTVIPFYNSEIINRYPIDSNSNTDISLEDFTQFFGPGGIIEDFFSNFLSAFVDMHKHYWQWRTLDNQQLPINRNFLNMFIRASMIQRMFFAHNKSYPGFSFKLTPIKLATDTQAVILNLGGQIVKFNQKTQEIGKLRWPGPNDNLLNIEFLSIDNRPINLSFSGPWAWFKLLSESHFAMIDNNVKRYTMTIESGSQGVSYYVDAETIINPFLPNVLSKFRCRKNI